MSPHLSLDIQVQIIKWLPVKSLIQFRSVCKEWKSLIGSSQFIACYNIRHHQSEHLLVRYAVGDGDRKHREVKHVCFVDHHQSEHLLVRYAVGDRKQREVKHVCFVDDDTFPQQKFNLTAPPLVQATTVIGSSHGLFCLTNYFQGPDDSSTKKLAILWNPTIRKSIAIVVPSRVHGRPFFYFIGFGVCPETKNPKIVYITYDCENPWEVMVFTLRSEEWRCLRSNQLPRKSIKFEGSLHIVVGQFIYWLAYDEDDENYEDDELHNLIMSFDLSTDEFREVHLPDTLCQKSDLTISKLRESFVVLNYNINSTTNKQVCDVWMMMEHGDEKVFTKLFTIKAPYAPVDYWIDGFRNNGEAIVVVHDDDDEDEHMFVVYDQSLEHIKDIVIRGPSISFHGSSYTYTESLLLLNHDDGRIVKCGAVESYDAPKRRSRRRSRFRNGVSRRFLHNCRHDSSNSHDSSNVKESE